MINVTASAARSSIIVPTGVWYVVKVTKMEQKAAKTDGSTNYNYFMEILSDLKGDETYAGCTVKPLLINEKGTYQSGISFLLACGFPQELFNKLKSNRNAEPEQVDPESPVGQTIKAFIKTTEYEGKKSNEATEFLPMN